jgi:hypothetical protein
MSEEKKESWASICVALSLFPAVMLLTAYTIKSLWWWFAVPLRLPAIGLAHAYGIELLVSAFVWPAFVYYSDKKKLAAERLLTSAGAVGFLLLFGKIAHALMAW